MSSKEEEAMAGWAESIRLRVAAQDKIDALRTRAETAERERDELSKRCEAAERDEQDALRDVEKVIQRRNGWRTRAETAEAELKAAREEIARLRGAFGAFDSAIEFAQKSRHNYQDWDDEQWGPIDAARTAFYGAPKPDGGV